jgi:hypothetical protein
MTVYMSIITNRETLMQPLTPFDIPIQSSLWDYLIFAVSCRNYRNWPELSLRDTTEQSSARRLTHGRHRFLG